MTLRHRQRCEGFRDRLRQAREAAGLTQEELRLKVGYSGRGAISALEKGRMGADIAVVERLAEALGVEPEWLAYGHQCPPQAEGHT